MSLGISGLSLNEALVVSATWGMNLIMAGAVNGVFFLGNWQFYRHRAAPAPGNRPRRLLLYKGAGAVLISSSILSTRSRTT